MINERVQYTAHTSTAVISAANPNLDGTGTTVAVLNGTGGSTIGTLIKTITIKAGASTTRGMVRLFIYITGSQTFLFKEVEVPPVTASGLDHSFQITLNVNLHFSHSDTLYASTENNETFYITAEGLDWIYP
jgi:hypothetical protein